MRLLYELVTTGAGAADSRERSVHGASVGFDAADLSGSGVTRAPTEAGRGKGEGLSGSDGGPTAELDAPVGWLADREFDAPLPEPHR